VSGAPASRALLSFLLLTPQLALWATDIIASFAGSGLFFSISGSRDRPSATGAKAHGLTCSLTRPLRAALPPLKCRNSSASFAGLAAVVQDRLLISSIWQHLSPKREDHSGFVFPRCSGAVSFVSSQDGLFGSPAEAGPPQDDSSSREELCLLIFVQSHNRQSQSAITVCDHNLHTFVLFLLLTFAARFTFAARSTNKMFLRSRPW
jgi:hypothetical protein